MPRYTFVLDFAGGTYVHQVHASSEREAPTHWARALQLEGVEGIGASDLIAIANGLKESEPVGVQGLKNVWCISAIAGERLVLAHVVQTSE